MAFFTPKCALGLPGGQFFASLMASESLGPPQLSGGDGRYVGRTRRARNKKAGGQILALPLRSCETLSRWADYCEL